MYECEKCPDISIHSRLYLGHAHALGDFSFTYKAEDDVYIICGKYPENSASGTWADMVELAEEILRVDTRMMHD
jgi:hypothetical protein